MSRSQLPAWARLLVAGACVILSCAAAFGGLGVLGHVPYWVGVGFGVSVGVAGVLAWAAWAIFTWGEGKGGG
ncbi:MAG: hypothetical protein HY323_09260 [Betaproteobacteria bacterium]|nr:hypothetical protein [Betaproteobacteria bacterium]